MIHLQEIVLRTEGWMQEFHKWHKPVARKAARELQKWRKPDEGWIKCNFDGAWNQSGRWGGYGVVLRNHLGEFLAATIGAIVSPQSALHTEFTAARQAMVMARRHFPQGLKFIFEGDATLVFVAM